MGSKTPEAEGHQHNDDPSSSFGADRAGGEPRGLHTSRDGDGCLGDASGEDDSDADQGRSPLARPLDGSAAQATSDATPKKRKKPKKKKKKTGSLKQSSPPRILLDELFPSGNYPEGQVQAYAKAPSAAAERRLNARLAVQDDEFFRTYRKAAEVHRQARQWVHDTVKPGQTLLSIANGIEDSVRALTGHAGLESGDSLKAGMGFPTGLCLNHEVAHYTPNPGQKDVVLQHEDVMKVDFGVHINGWIIDSAFTMSFDPVYDNLLSAVKDSTESGIKTAGIDVRISDVSAAIQETMESWEVEIRGKTYPIKPVRNLCAHNIQRYHIHGDKAIPMIKNKDQTKMEEGEVFAIETFGTTGRGYTRDDLGVYGYKLVDDAPLRMDLPLASAKRLHKTIRENFGPLVFCRRYLDRLGLDRYLAGMNCLIQHGIIEAYEPMAEVKGSYSAQFEHTLILREGHKEIFSRGADY